MKPTKKGDDDSLLQYPNKIIKVPVLRKSKYYINISSSDITTTVALLAHRWQCRKKKKSLLVLGFKFQKFIHESCHDGVSGTDNDEQPLNNSASVFYLWLLEAFSRFQNGSILLVNAELS